MMQQGLEVRDVPMSASQEPLQPQEVVDVPAFANDAQLLSPRGLSPAQHPTRKVQHMIAEALSQRSSSLTPSMRASIQPHLGGGLPSDDSVRIHDAYAAVSPQERRSSSLAGVRKAVGDTSESKESKRDRTKVLSTFANNNRELRDPMNFPVVDKKTGKMHLPASARTFTSKDRKKICTYERTSGHAQKNALKEIRFPQMDWWSGRLPPARGQNSLNLVNAMTNLTQGPKKHHDSHHLTLRTVRDICGWYFHDVTENTFLAKEVVCNLGDHVDIALRLAGLIKQTAQFKTMLKLKPVVYDEASWMWVKSGSRVPVSGGNPKPRDLVDRVDLVPTGIISVVGSLDIAELSQEVLLSKKAPRNDVKIKKKARTGSVATPLALAGSARSFGGSQEVKPAAAPGTTPSTAAASALPAEESSFSGYDVKSYDNDDDDEQMIMVIGDPDSEFLSTAEVLKYIKHYLTRAVVKAAKSAGASILCDGTGDIARQLSIGYQSFVDPVGIKGNKAAVNTQLVGVSARCEADAVSLDASHNILLQCDGGHVLAHADFGPKHGDLYCTECGDSRQPPLSSFDPNGFCEHHPDCDRLRATSVTGKINRPTDDAIRLFKLRMLEALNNGHYQRVIENEGEATLQAPNREAIPVMIIVFGGSSDVTRREVHTSAKRGWPILVVEGSGGYADVLCSTISKMNALSPDASSDDYRRLLTTVDPETSAIISNGNCHVIPRGSKVAEVERLIVTALKGDEILHQAWKWYSSWYYNQLEWSYNHQVQQLAVLLLGIFATLASVTQTFLILLYRERTTDADFVDRWAVDEVLAEEKYWYMMFRLQQWLVIGLPITLTLVHAIFQRMNPWAKVCAFRVAASSLLCEIYMYRTRTMGYSTEAVKRNRAEQGLQSGDSTGGGKGAALKMIQKAEEESQQKTDPKEAEEASAIGAETRFVYSSREELLGHKMRKFQLALGASEAGMVRLEVNVDRNIPPSVITKTGDGGLSDLTPDEYVKFRVSTQRREYWKKHRSLDGQQSMLTFLVIFFGAAGTALAALSAYGLGYLQAWVAFSTVVVNSLTRFLDFTRISAMAELCNTAEHQLGSVERWWSSVGTDADSDRNRTKLVADAEHAIRLELEGWSKQMQSMDDDDEDATGGDSSDSRKESSREEDVAAAESKALGTDMLKADTVMKGLQDRGGHVAQRIKRQILDLNDKLGGFIKPPPLNPNSSNASREARRSAPEEEARGPLSAIRGARQHAASSFPIPQVFHDVGIRAAFLDLLKPDEYLDYRSLTGFSLRQSLCLLSTQAAEAMSHIRDTLHVTAIAKRMILDQFDDEFQRVLDALPADVRGSFSTEDFVTSMCHSYTTFGSQLRYVTKESLAQVLDHVGVKEAILLMKYEMFTEMIRICSEGFSLRLQRHALAPLSWDRGQGSLACLTEMLKGVAIVEAFERVHVRILNLGTEEETRQVARMIDNLSAQSLPLALLSKADLLSLVPPGMFPDWRSLSGLQLGQIMRVIACGTAASRCVMASQILLEAQSRTQRTFGEDEEGSGLIEWVMEPTRREVFVAANELLTQLVINRSSKTDLIRAMQATKAMTKEFADSLSAATDEHTLKGVLSTLQAQQSNSFASSIVQRLADSFFLVDYQDLLTGDEIECLASSVAQVPSTFAVGGMSKEELLGIVPLPTLRRQLEGLDEEQLRRLYLVQRLLLSTEYSQHVWAKTMELGGIGSLARQHMMRSLHPLAIQRLVYRITYMSKKEMLDFCQFLSLAKLLQQVGDAVVTQALFGVCVDPTQEHNYATEFGRIIEDVYSITHPEEDILDGIPSRSSNPLLLRLCHSIRTLQGRSSWVDLFFRMEDDYLSVDLASFHRLVEMKADKLLLLDLDDEDPEGKDNVGVEDMIAVFELTEPSRMEDLQNLRRKLMDRTKGADSSHAVRLRQTLVEMDIFLDLEFPYMMFEEIAQSCTQFDLRDVVVNSTDRHVFAVSWFEFLAASDEYVAALCDVSQVQLVDHDADLAIPMRENDAMVFKDNLLTSLLSASIQAEADGSNLRFGDMDLLLSTVRALHNAHVVQLAVVLDTIFHSAAGVVFQWYCENRRQRATMTSGESHVGDEGGHTSNSLSLEQVASHVLCIARGNRQLVDDALCHYDSERFFHTRRSKRVVGSLRQTIPNDLIVDSLLMMDHSQINWLFIMIQYTLEAEFRCMRSDEFNSKRMKKTFAEKLKSNRSGAAAGGAGRVLKRFLTGNAEFEQDFV